MKLKKYEDKSKKKRKVLLISLGVIVLVSISFLLYKTFAVFNEHVEFPMMNGKVDYFGNSDVYFVFYKGDNQLLEEMPQKDNTDNLVFDHAECDNGAEVEWNEEEWAPLVKGLNSPKTKCSLYFKKFVEAFDKKVVECGQSGTSATTCITNNASLDETLIKDNFDNLRFTGANPNNYVTFNGTEKWRIMGIIDGKLKIIRSESIGEMAWDSSGNYNWATSSLANYLNNTYKINSNLIVEGSWNVGDTIANTPLEFYNSEKQQKWTGRVGLMNVSDFGFAEGGETRDVCLTKNLGNFNREGCGVYNWLKPRTNVTWTLISSTPLSGVFNVSYAGFVGVNVPTFNYNSVNPSVYLDSNVKIIGGTGGEGSPFELSL